ncbi:MAG: serine/threonine protein kinase [Candidatus Marinamargulisbacteria bacterium]|jgi:serine/threonine protein kinase
MIKQLNQYKKLQHPNLVHLLDFRQTGTADFEELLEHIYPISPEEVSENLHTPAIFFRLFAQLLDGLSAIHKESNVHKDVHPGNILFEKTAAGLRVRIADFGLLTPFSAEGTSEGTPKYKLLTQGDFPIKDIYGAAITMGALLLPNLDPTECDSVAKLDPLIELAEYSPIAPQLNLIRKTLEYVEKEMGSPTEKDLSYLEILELIKVSG